MTRNGAIGWLLVLGGGLIALAFYLQSQVNRAAAVAYLTGDAPSGSVAPWACGALGAGAVIAALVIAGTTGRAKQRAEELELLRKIAAQQQPPTGP